MTDEQINRRIAPEPKKVPLEAHDIPDECWLQWPSRTTYKRQITYGPVQVIGVKETGVDIMHLSGPFHYTFEDLFDRPAEYSSDRKTWLPCSKEVAE